MRQTVEERMQLRFEIEEADVMRCGRRRASGGDGMEEEKEGGRASNNRSWRWKGTSIDGRWKCLVMWLVSHRMEPALGGGPSFDTYPLTDQTWGGPGFAQPRDG